MHGLDIHMQMQKAPSTRKRECSHTHAYPYALASVHIGRVRLLHRQDNNSGKIETTGSLCAYCTLMNTGEFTEQREVVIKRFARYMYS